MMASSPITPEWLAATEDYRKAVNAFRTHIRSRKACDDFEAWYEQAQIDHEVVQTTLLRIEKLRRLSEAILNTSPSKSVIDAGNCFQQLISALTIDTSTSVRNISNFAKPN